MRPLAETSMKHHLRLALVFLLLGLLTNIAVAWLLAALIDVELGKVVSAQQFDGQSNWSVTQWQRPGAMRVHSTRVKGFNWSPEQATGQPDTPNAGDQVTAWASRSSDGGTEWLLLDYAKPVTPREVHVYESYCPGALFKITVFDENDGAKEIVAWTGTDPTPATTAIGVSQIPIPLNVKTRQIRLWLACDKVPGWNEIDAVALVSSTGELQWARKAQASSTYATNTFGSTAATAGPSPAVLLPAWCPVHHPAPDFAEGRANREEIRVDARGWPMVSFYSWRDALRGGRAKPATTNPSPLPTSSSPPALDGPGIITTNSVAPLSGTSPFTATSSTPPPGIFVPPAAPTVGSSTASTGVPGIPIHPIWPGLIGNTLLFAIAWLLLWFVLIVPRRFVREVARLRRGCCVECGYDLGFDFVRGCPECGWRRGEKR